MRYVLTERTCEETSNSCVTASYIKLKHLVKTGKNSASFKSCIVTVCSVTVRTRGQEEKE